ncbi:DUF1152 domain-containing protein [Curtobacterium sp. UCD-KPL2560]|uniref:DUF1152 domain-containing protein n=1 Tax=Curtobacterium sp. UCD-KPL2560 TaxID=1885315 RepID=UPI0008259B43|nr:DUF1152 domain-containing protein [Curtobacterium sp. UCD-KPL2560]
MTVYMAAGGPGDLIVAAALSEVSPIDSFVTFAWRRDALSAGYSPWSALHGVDRAAHGRVDPETFTIDGRWDQVRTLAQNLPGSLHLLDVDDLSWSAGVLNALVSKDVHERVVLVDAGGDILGESSHEGLTSPLLEALAIRLVIDADQIRAADVIVAGPGVDNELTQVEITVRLSEMPHEDCRIDAGAPKLLDVFDAVDSEASRLWLSALSGRRGRVWCDGRGRPVHLNCFAARAVRLPLTALTRNPGLAVRPAARGIRDANVDLVDSGYVDEMRANASRLSVLPIQARREAVDDCRVGDFVTNRFQQRYGRQLLTVRSVGDGLLSRIEAIGSDRAV